MDLHHSFCNNQDAFGKGSGPLKKGNRMGFCILVLMVIISCFAQDAGSRIAVLSSKDLQRTIAYTMEFANKSYETDELFKKRLLDTQDRLHSLFPVPPSKKLSPHQFIMTNAWGSLELVDITSHSTHTIIKSNADNKFLYTVYLAIKDKIKHDFVAKNRTDLFAVSPNTKFVAAVVDSNRIELHTLDVEHNKTVLHKCFPLDNYYKEYGHLQASDDRQRLEYLHRGYFSKKEYCKFSGGYSFDTAKSVEWHKPIMHLCVANDGKLAFCNDTAVFLVESKSNGVTYKKMYENSLKFLGPCRDGNDIEFLAWKEGNFLNISFNKQDTKLAIIHQAIVDLLPNAQDVIKTEEMPDLNTFYKKLIVNWISKKYNHLTEIEEKLKKAESLVAEDYLVAVQNLLPAKLFEKLIASFDGNKVDNEISIIPLKADIWDLATYLRLKGVCKKFY